MLKDRGSAGIPSTQRVSGDAGHTGGPLSGLPSAGFRARDYLLRVYSFSGCLLQAGREAKPALSVAKPAEPAVTVPAPKSLVRTSQGRVNTRTGQGGPGFAG